MPIATISYIEIDVVGMLILGLIFFSKRGARGQALDQKLFDLLTVATMVMLVLDAGMWVFDGLTFPGARALNMLVTALYYIDECVIPCIWLFYAKYKITRDYSVIRDRLGTYVAPACFNAVLAVASLWTGWFYVIDPQTNVYARGSLFLVHAIICVAYMVIPTVEALSHARRSTIKEVRSNLLFLAAFPVLPFVGLVVQGFMYGISLVWICTAASCLMVFINVQNMQISTDGLTDINNRRSMDDYLARSLRELPAGRQFGAMLIDVDGFKQINDVHGHAAGDQALMKIAELLKVACDSTRLFLARMGGDEFVIMGPCHGEEDFRRLNAELQKSVDKLNRSNIFTFDVALSTGCAMYQAASDDADSLMRRADAAMYATKARHKRAVR